MSKITFKNNPVRTTGSLPAVGSQAPNFSLTKTDLSDVSLKDFLGKKIILNIFVSLDTSVCAASVRQFNQQAEKLDDVVILCISADLPFAHARFCTTEGLQHVISLSDFRHKEFGELYGVRIIDGVLAGLLSRAIVVLDATGKIVYIEQVPEITQEPNYQAALDALKR